MNLIYNKDDISRILDFLEKSKQSALILTAELCSCNESGKIKKVKLLILEFIGYVTPHYLLRKCLRNSGLTYAGLTYKARIVLLSS